MKANRPMRWIVGQSRGSRGQLGLLVVASLGMTAVNLGMTVILKSFTDYATGDTNLSILTITGAALVVILLEGLFSIATSLCTKLAYSRTERKIRLSMIEVVSKSQLLSLKKMHTGEVLTRLTKDVELVSQCLPTLINTVFSGCLMAVVALAYMFLLSWKLSIAIVVVIPLLMGIVSVFSPRLQARAKVDKENEDVNRNQMQDVIENVPLIQTYRAQSFILGKLAQAHGKKYASAKSLGVVEGVFSFLNNTMGTSMFLVVMGFGAYLTTQGEFTVGSMIAMIQLLNYIVWPFSNISNAVAQVNQANISASRINEVLDLPLAMRLAEGEEKPGFSAASLVADAVHFAYDADMPVLQNVNARFEKGRIAAIYGRSGSGKSTLLCLLLGLYKPNTGSIALLGEHSPQGGRLEGAELNRYMSYVPSDHMLYSGTVGENIRMGAPADENRLWEIAKICNIDELIRSMPDGMNTLIGNGGQSVSSGQAQRIAIARAVYKNAQVIIMDEPTSNLDQESIALLMDMLRSIAQNRIIIIVTHEGSLTQICDDLFLLQNSTLAPVTAAQLNNESGIIGIEP